MTDHNEVADVLDDAADRLERGGWQQGANGPEEGPNCSAGAIYHVCGQTDSPVFHAARFAFVQVIDTAICIWNDDPARTKQEVLDTFRLAAKQERILADAES